MAHSPEPWKCHDDSVVECEVTIHDSLGYERLNSEKGCRTEWAVENFPRIVACVNACRGIPTEAVGVVIDRLFTAMMVEEGERRRGRDERDLSPDLLIAAGLMTSAGVDLTELLKQCKLEGVQHG